MRSASLSPEVLGIYWGNPVNSRRICGLIRNFRTECEGSSRNSGKFAALQGFQRLCEVKIGRTKNIPEILGVRPGCIHRISSAAACLHALRSTVRPGRFPYSALPRAQKVGSFAAWDGPSTAAAPQAATASGAPPWGRHADFWLSWRAREAQFRKVSYRAKH